MQSNGSLGRIATRRTCPGSGLGRSGKVSSMAKNLHTLSISAPVTGILWRPPANTNGYFPNKESDVGMNSNCYKVDHHDAILAISTASTGGANVGGKGCVGLWSFHRPFMPLSLVEGHSEGAVTEFLWVDTPDRWESYKNDNYNSYGNFHNTTFSPSWILDSKHSPTSKEVPTDIDSLQGMWQHILSVGRDGKCLLQSFARGERPIYQVPPSLFALGNLCPFQRGFGSIKVLTVHQDVPSGDNNDYALCGLRRDNITSLAPGVFQELPVPIDLFIHSQFKWIPKAGGRREPSASIDMSLYAMDYGEIDKKSEYPISQVLDEIGISPEIVYLPRFAVRSKLRRGKSFPTKYSLCTYNSKVAYDLNCEFHGRMWNMLATILESSESDDSHVAFSDSRTYFSNNTMTFILLPTVRSLLLEREEAGDIQSCVVLCEVMEVVPPQKTLVSGQRTFKNILSLDLDIDLVCEWYLSYIDLLQQMCMFSYATELIKYSRILNINNLNQQSTTVTESCTNCSKPLQDVSITSEIDRWGQEKNC